MAHCGECYDDPHSLLSAENILQYQKVSDVLIALAYFSIPVELLYLVASSSLLPFRWILVECGAFVVLCGLTHILTAFTFSPHSFLLMLSLTVAKFLTALVSVAAAVMLLTLIPQLLRVFVREGLLRKKARDLDREVGLMKRQEEARWHVRMLTREIRHSLDRHTILYTTLVELSKSLFLHHCSIWMPSPPPQQSLVLTYEVTRRDLLDTTCIPRHERSIPVDDLAITEIIRSPTAIVLDCNSGLVCLGDEEEPSGPVAAVRLPLLKAANFKLGTPEFREESYAILVLALAVDEGNLREWTAEEIEIVEVVADQVAVALSHASVLEESLAVRKQLMDQNTMLKQARQDAEMANEARSSFQKVVGREMMAPVRLVEALLSALQLGSLRPEQAMLVKGGSVLSALIEDATVLSSSEDEVLELVLKPFSFLPMMKELVKVAAMLCAIRVVGFEFHVGEEIPKRLIGDEKRILEVVVYMVEVMLESCDQGRVVLHVSIEGGSQGLWKKNKVEEFVNLRFKVERVDYMCGGDIKRHSLLSEEEENQGPDLSICRKLAQLMQGDVSANFDPPSPLEVSLLIRLGREQLLDEEAFRPRCLDDKTALSLLKGMRILVGAGEGLNRSITKKVLEKAGCEVILVSSWHECLDALYLNGKRPHLLLIEARILEEGSDISGRVRKLRLHSWLLILGLISSCDGDAKVKCLQSGVHGVIFTPVILDELLAELERVRHHLHTGPTF